METVLFVVHIMVVLALIVIVLLQRSEGGALGIGGGGGGGGMMGSRAAGDILTRVTTILALCFFLTSIGIAVLGQVSDKPADILDQLETSEGAATGSEGVLDTLQGEIKDPAAEPAVPTEPQVPTGN